MDTESFLREVAAVWEQLLPRCRKAKQKYFGKTADRAWAFLGKSYKELYIDAVDDAGEKFPFAEGQVWHTRRNLSREYVAVMLPYIHGAKIQSRLVLPRREGLPPELAAISADPNQPLAPVIQEAMVNQQARQPVEAMGATLLRWFLNYLPAEYDLFSEQRRGLPEALVKGRAILWTVLEDKPGFGPMPVSEYDSVDGLICDSDSRHWKQQNFIARERCESIYSTAERFGIPAEELRGKYSSSLATGEKPFSDSTENTGASLIPRQDDREKDVCVYYEVYSRMGIGHHMREAPDSLKELGPALSELGNNCFLVIMEGMGYPLNLPPHQLGETPDIGDLKRRLAWPIPFHADAVTDPWPCVKLDFMSNSNDPWATSPLEGSLPLLAFIDHAYNYLLNRCKTTCRNLFLASKTLKESIIKGIAGGQDLEFIFVDGQPGVEFDKLLKAFEFPKFSRELLLLVDKVERAFELSAGMDPRLYGAQAGSQDRSATATRARESRLSSRPDDFADCVRDWNSRIAAKEALATRLYVGENISDFFGEQSREVPDPSLDPAQVEQAMAAGQQVPMITVPGPLTRLWQEFVQVGHADMTPDELIDAATKAAAEYVFTVESGAGRRRDLEKQSEDFQALSQMLLPMFTQMAMGGYVGPFNAMMSLAGQVYERSMDAFMLAPPQQPPPQEGEEEEE